MSEIETLFEIEKGISKIINLDAKLDTDEIEWFDAGMFIEQDTPEMWRDYSLGYNDSKEYYFSFSSKGELKGDVPPQHSVDILCLLEQYK